MSDNELLLAISDIVKKNVDVLESRLSAKIDAVEERLSARIDELDHRLSARIDELDYRLSARIDALEVRVDALDAKIDSVDKRLSEQIKTINRNLENIVIPRLNNIEKCYTSTYDRYRDGVKKLETLEMNMDVMRSVMMQYGERLNAMTA